MTLSFPADPAAQTPVNTYSPTSTPESTDNGVTYIWDGSLWNASSRSFPNIWSRFPTADDPDIGTIQPSEFADRLEVGGDGLCVIDRRVGVGRHPATEDGDAQLQVGGDAEIAGGITTAGIVYVNNDSEESAFAVEGVSNDDRSGRATFKARNIAGGELFNGTNADGSADVFVVDSDGNIEASGDITCDGQIIPGRIEFAGTGINNAYITSNTFQVRAGGTVFIGDDISSQSNIELNSNGSATLAGNLTVNNGGTYETGIIADTTRDRISYTNPNANVITMFSNNFGNGVSLDKNSSNWGSFSQRSLKTDLIPITDGLNKVAGLSGVIGRYKTDAQGTKRAFLIADEVKEVLPEAVSGSGTLKDPLTLRYSEVIPLLVSALHDAKDRIEALEAQLAALSGPSTTDIQEAN